MAKARTDAQLLAAFASERYEVYGAAEAELRAWFAAHPAEARARAERLGALALTPKHAAARTTLGYTILSTLAAGPTLPAKWDPLVTAFGRVEEHRAVLAKIPVARRTAIFEREVKGNAPSAVQQIGEHYLDLAPEVTKAILELAEARGELARRIQWGVFTKWSRRVPRVREIVKSFAARAAAEKKKAQPPPAPKPKGTLSFVDGIAIEPSDYPSLDAVMKAQYRIAAQAYIGGGPLRDAKAFVKRLEKEEMNERDASMRRWRVLRGESHVYDFWVVWVDNGTVFLAGTADRAPVQQIQDDFQATSKKASAKSLAADFAASAPKDLWTVSTPKKKRR